MQAENEKPRQIVNMENRHLNLTNKILRPEKFANAGPADAQE